MGTSLIEQTKNLMQDDPFKAHLEVILVRVAADILKEENTIKFHNQRANWAVRVVNDSTREARRAVLVLLGQSTAVREGDKSDVLLYTELMKAVNTLAGAFTPEPLPPEPAV